MPPAIFRYYIDFFRRHHRLEHYKNKLSNLYYQLTQKPFEFNNQDYTKEYIPVIINNFNRLRTLKILVEWLLSENNKVIVIILDNNSTYPPLLDYYKSLTHKNVYLKRFNFNGLTRMILPIAKSLRKFDHFVITDPDLIPCNISSIDLFKKMKNELKQYPEFNHVGVSLEIDDLPDFFPLKEKVLEWESQFWKVKAGNNFVADIDTTFAMYSRKSNPRARYPALRMNRPYTFTHVDWYIDPHNLDEEYKFYLRHCHKIASWAFEMMQKHDLRNLLGIDKDRTKGFKSYY